MALSSQDLQTLRAVCNAIVPSIEMGDTLSAELSEFHRRTASDLGVDKALADIINTKLEPARREDFKRLLTILESRAYNLILSGSPIRFSDLRANSDRERYLGKWRDSRLGAKRQAFQALKRLICFLYYAVPTAQGLNPNWSVLGYPGPSLEAESLEHPEALRIQGLKLDKDSSFDCDVCIVGSGAGGSVIAYELCRLGFNVMVAEAGSYETASTFEQSELKMMDKIFDESGTASTKDLSFVLLSGKGAGGGTTVNWMTSIKPPREVMADWEKEYGIYGLTAPQFYSSVDEIWNLLKVNLDESQRNGNNEVIYRGCKSLGYAEGIDFEPIWRNAVGCGQRCAFCTYGCKYSCKQSTLLNYLPLAYAVGARFVFNAKIARVILSGGVARGVEGKYSSSNGKTYSIKINSKVVVLACGAIKTPALLLASEIRSKNIGKNLRLHPTTAISGHFKEEIRAWDGPPQTVMVTKFLKSDGPRHGFWIEAAPSHPGLFALSAPWTDGISHKDYMRKFFNHSSATIILLKEWGSGTVGIDKHGSPKVSYKLENRDKKNMVRGMEKAAGILVAAGANGLSSLHSEGFNIFSNDGSALKQSELDAFEVGVEARGIAPNKAMLFSAHLMGSCRMGSDDSRCAANPEGELFGVKNLFIGDGSVFPTTLGVNPMITIMAMAKRTAGYVTKRLTKE